MKNKKDPIPGKDATREELAEFWDTHSFADYLDELKPAKVTFAKNFESITRIDLDSKTSDKLESVARKKGVSPISLAKEWILEHLQS